MNLMERAKKAEALKVKVFALYDELIPKHRTYTEIATLTGTTKANVCFILKGRKSRARGKI